MTLSLLNSFFSAANMVLGGIAGRRIPNAVVLGVASLSALSVSIIALLWGGGAWSLPGIGLGAIAGISGGVGLLMAYRAFAIGPVGVVGAVVATTSTALVAIVGFVTESSATWFSVGGLFLCIIAIAVVTLDKGRLSISASALALSLGAGIAAGGFAILMNLAPQSDGFGTLVAVRVGVVVVAMCVVAAYSRPLHRETITQPGRGLWVALAAGCADGLANVFVILALDVTDLATIAVISALTPALVALLGWLILREKLRSRQVLGLIIAVGAIALTAQS